MTITRDGCVLALISLLLLCATSSSAETWQDERYQLSMKSPSEWVAMSPGLLARTNAQVSHLTGRGFIAGYALNESDTLVFPYLLVQFKPYTSLPEQYRPASKLDERARLELIYALVGAFREKGPLPADIDTPQFINRFSSRHATLTRHEDDGRFDFTGKIPNQGGSEPIEYHTHGIFGKEGIALVSVFSIDNFSGLTYVTDNDMRTLAFAEGFGADALPDQPPAVEPDPATSEPPATDGPDTTEPKPEATAAEEKPVDETEAAVAETPGAEETPDPVNPSTGKADSTALIVILSLLGVFLFAAAFIAWFIAHKQAQAKRERNRARRERREQMQAGQTAAAVKQAPRPTEQAKARSHGSSGRQKRGRTRS